MRIEQGEGAANGARGIRAGDIYRVEITDTNENGDGFAKIDRLAVFTHGLVSGDIADIKIYEKRKNYALAECLEIIKESQYRIPSECETFEKCGGCTLCHVSYEYENLIKRNCVRSALRRTGLPYDMVAETIFCDRTGYRNKIGLHYSKKTHSFGYYARDEHEILPFEGCRLCDGAMNEIVSFTNENIGLIEDFSPEELFIRKSHDGRFTISLYLNSDKIDIDSYRAAVTERFKDVCDVLAIGAERELERADNRENLSERCITEEYMGIRMRISTESFRQVNHDAAEVLMELVCGYAGEQEFSCAADLYCGSGTFGLVLAKKCPNAAFFGIEIDNEGIRMARINAEENKLGNIEFICADAASFNGRIPAIEKPAELVIVDPPRAGLSGRMRASLISLKPGRIVYVSCNPQTMARDISELVRSGYEINRVTPVNMFPMTGHVETVCLMSRVKE